MKNLLNAIPNMKNIYWKSAIKVRMITIIFEVILPGIIFAFVCKAPSIFTTISFLWLFIGSCFNVVTIVDSFLTIRVWSKRYKKYIKPLYELDKKYKYDEKELIIKFLFDSHLFYTEDLNIENPSFIESIAITYCLRNKKNWWIILIPFSSLVFTLHFMRPWKSDSFIWKKREFKYQGNTYKVARIACINPELINEAEHRFQVLGFGGK